MTDDPKNGAAPMFTAGPRPQTPEEQMIALQAAIAPIVANTLRGLLMARGQYDPAAIMSLAAFALGAELMRGLTVGDLPTELRLKKMFRESFENGIKSVHVRTMPLQPQEVGSIKA